MSSKYSKPTKFIRALIRKGFKEVMPKGKSKSHILLYLYVNEKQTPIYTIVSRGSQRIKKWEMGEKYKHLRMPNKHYLMDLLKCPITEDEYVQYLREGGFLLRE